MAVLLLSRRVCMVDLGHEATKPRQAQVATTKRSNAESQKYIAIALLCNLISITPATPQLSAGNCNVVEDSGAGSPPDSDAETSSGDLCTQPSESSCVELDIAVREVSGPSVGMYYDESCLEGGGGRTGCGGGGVPACRLCFVNRDFWNADFAELRFPDW